MRVLITGAAGNLGSHLVRHLLPSRHEIRAVIHRMPLPADIADAPEKIDIVLINRPEIAPSGGGEPSTRTVPAAIANAIFDATGIRLRKVPLTRERMKEALARA